MEIRNFRPQKITRLHGFRSTRLPRGRDCVGGVLPAVVADTAKAEGVAIGRTAPKLTRTPRGQTYERSARRGAFPRPQKIPLLHESFSTRLPRGRDCVGGVLPAVVADTAKAEGVAPGRSATRQRDLPRGQTYERSARRRASPRPQKIPLLHESFNTQLPRGGRVGRVLPAVVADTAKAEGVAPGRSATRQRDLPRGQTYERSARRGAFPRPQKIPLLHESFNTRLPREGAAERLRELP